MANKLRVGAAERVVIEVNDNGDEISFIPDVAFVERLYSLMGEVKEMGKQVEDQQKNLTANDAKDEHGIPANMGDRIKLVKDTCLSMEEKIDSLIGEGTCKKALGGAMSPELYLELLDGIMPFIQEYREMHIDKYLSPEAQANREQRRAAVKK